MSGTGDSIGMKHHSAFFRFSALAVLCSAGSGCEQYELHDLGNTLPDGESNTREANPPTDLPDVTLADLAGVWVGEVELFSALDPDPGSYRFPSGSSEIVMELTGTAELFTFLVGTLRFGEGLPPAPATDPERGYPVDASDFFYGSSPDAPPPIEGFSHALHSASVYPDSEAFAEVLEDLDGEASGDLPELLHATNRYVRDNAMSFGFSTNEVLASWCALQTFEECGTVGGVGVVAGVDGCVATRRGDTNQCEALESEPVASACLEDLARNAEPMDCNKAMLCASERCVCNPGNNDCSWNGQPFTKLHLQLDPGGDLVGQFGGLSLLDEQDRVVAPLGLVRFTRTSTAPDAKKRR